MTNAQAPPTNLGPIRTTTNDGIGIAGTPALPPVNMCRGYYNTQTGAYSWIKSDGTSCGPNVTGSCPNCIQTSGGNAAIAGTFGANALQTTGPFPWEVVGTYGAQVCPSSGFSSLGFGVAGVPTFCINGGSPILAAYQDGSGNVAQNANTASALAATPAQCAGQYATGIAANGNANCNTSTIVLIPQQLCSALAGVPGSAEVCFDNGGALQTNLSNAGWNLNFLGYTNLIQTGDTLEQRDGTNAQTYNFYSVWSAAGVNYQRLQTSFDATNNAFNIASQAGGSPGSACSGGVCDLEFSIGSARDWTMDSLHRFVPVRTDNTQDIGHNGNRIRDLWIGRALRTGTASNTDLAGTITVTASTTGTYTFVNTGYVSSPICSLTPTTDPTSVGTYWATTTPTVLTANVHTSGTITFNYTCFPRN